MPKQMEWFGEGTVLTRSGRTPPLWQPPQIFVLGVVTAASFTRRGESDTLIGANSADPKTRKRMNGTPDNNQEVLTLLDIHYKSFIDVKPYADKYGHPHPCDTRAWSQILVSALTGLKGIERKKGADFDDGSDVKGANTWGAIDTPRFNGCLKAGTKSDVSGTMKSLGKMPNLFFVLWDAEPTSKKERCRVWVVSPGTDKVFRKMAALWYRKRASGEIESNNFQLHPPRNKNSNVIRNTCGNLEYPLFFAALREETGFAVTYYLPEAKASGQCKRAKKD